MFFFNLSLLLFAKLQDYPQCQALANIWLRNPDNYTDPEYPHIVDIFVQRVMFPWKLHSLVPAFLDTCLGLDATQRQLMMQVCFANITCIIFLFNGCCKAFLP